MLSIELFSIRKAPLACAGLTGLLAVSGCAMLHPHHSVQAAVAAPAVVQSAPEVVAPQPQTVTDALPDSSASSAAATSAEAPGPAEGASLAQAPGAPVAAPVADTLGTDATTVIADAGSSLKPTAPKNYVVKRGDTLWGIANMFLKSPWVWPEIWYVNPEIHNPHRIYPGDTVRLALAGDGRTELQLVRGPAGQAAAARAVSATGAPLASARLEPLLRSSPLDAPIDTIPYSVISVFISHPSVLTREQIQASAYIVALAQSHDVAGTGHELFVRKSDAPAGSRFSVMHIDEPLRDPDNGHELGYVAIYTGSAQITRPGKVAEAVLTSSARETLQGDVLIPEEHEPTTDFVPHSPQRPLDGRVIDVIDNVLLAGQYQVVALNRGSDDGLDRGSVLAVDQEAEVVTDTCASIDGNSACPHRHAQVTMPTDPAGTLLVFRTFPHMSYALILADVVPVEVGDRVRAP
ncbi:MAG TPA: LysM peptidoglycan-binding domain-containing protein [Steroidobacteraceae bacterium]|nr:LysM peptidoglycan-binding domain-containing protein [Steroidobacteraceae bacterium]